MDLMEHMMQRIFKNVLNVDIQIPFKRITWDDAMNLYGSDKPDLRFDMHFYDISDLLRDTGFKVFRNVLDNGGIVKAITVKGDAAIPRRELDSLVDYVGNYGAKGLAWIGLNKDGSLKCQITKFLGEDKIREIGNSVKRKMEILFSLLQISQKLSPRRLANSASKWRAV